MAYDLSSSPMLHSNVKVWNVHQQPKKTCKFKRSSSLKHIGYYFSCKTINTTQCCNNYHNTKAKKDKCDNSLTMRMNE